MINKNSEVFQLLPKIFFSLMVKLKRSIVDTILIGFMGTSST